MKLSDFDFRIWDGKKYLKQKIYNDNINNNEYIAVTGNVDDENYVLTIEHSYESNYYGGDYDEYCKVKDFTSCNYEIELFTGLYDKNGNKIYENDIVEYHENEALIIKYIKGTFYACQDYEKFMKKYECQDNKDTEKFWLEEAYKINNLRIDDNNFIARFEIIGNIHENAELLK
ncbi:YopX family protein [Campylobacter jejuni]|uniref:YopX family protein n=1 Tax=Campylobacter jejuni TaxID=197 RepID=UPI000F8003AC|nr:YopX family protein [Campylobacter jejuni]MEA8965205.1 YopX family protein [Campylobacter jejuni]MEA8973857.1 YopX family protein [Campylobacter jejuni]